jgi:hypothetical protein
MATLNGVNSALINADPSSKAAIGDQGGRIRLLKDLFSLSGDLAVNDIIKMGGKLPKGAKIVEAVLSWSALGAGTLDVGWAAGAGALEAADADGIFDGLAVTAAGAANLASSSHFANPGYLKDFVEEVQLQVLVATDTTALTGDIELVVMYVVE